MRNQIDQAGNKIQAVARQLIVGPDNEWTAKEITSSVNQAFEQSNTKNVVEGLSVVVMDYITGSTWVLRDPSFKNLVHMWRERPFYDSQTLPKTIDFFMFGVGRWDNGYYDFHGLVGSAG